MISPSDYLFISDMLGYAQDSGQYILPEIYSLYLSLGNNSETSSNNDKQVFAGIITNTYYIEVNKQYNVTTAMKNAIVALQTYVVSASGGSIDTFLANNDIKVSSEFAILSAQVGFPVGLANTR